MNKVFIAFFLVCGISIGLFSQTTTGKSKKLFQGTFNEYVEMLDGKREISLKRAVFTYLKEPNALNNHQPYAYDFEDFSGQKDFSKMFVTKLLRIKKGNCLSFPLLYKILCDELGAKSYLALAPKHLYIKHQDETGQWINVELTNGGFPKDQWIIQQLGISVEAIKSEIYMDPLSEEESIVLCMKNLANAYHMNSLGYSEMSAEQYDELMQNIEKAENINNN